MFEQEIINNQLWCNTLSIQIKCLLPINIQYESEVFDYFVFYNITKNEYNKLPDNGNYECIFIAYDCDLSRLLILDDYTINLQ